MMGVIWESQKGGEGGYFLDNGVKVAVAEDNLIGIPIHVQCIVALEFCVALVDAWIP